MVNRRRFIAAAAALPLSACKIKTINYFPTTPANVRFANLLPNGGPLDVYVNGANVWPAVGFEATVPYDQFEPEETTFGVNQTGKTTQLSSTTVSLSGKQPYTLASFGSLANPAVLLLGDTTFTIPSGSTQVRFCHAAFGLAAVDIYITPPGVDFLLVTAVFFGIGYSQATLFTQFPSGDYVLRMCVANTKGVIYDSGVITYGSGVAVDQYFYTRESAVLGNVMSLEVNYTQSVAIVETRQTRVKAVNAAFQTGDVNFLTDGATEVTTLRYGEASIYRIPVAGSHVLSFEATAVPGATIASTTQVLAPATDSTVFVSGFAGSTVATRLDDHNLLPAGGNGKFRFVNASPDAPPVDVFVNGVLAAVGIAYTKASGYYEIPANICIIRFVNAAGAMDLLTLPDIALEANMILSVYMAGAAANTRGIVTQDNVLATA